MRFHRKNQFRNSFLQALKNREFAGSIYFVSVSRKTYDNPSINEGFHSKITFSVVFGKPLLLRVYICFTIKDYFFLLIFLT